MAERDFAHTDGKPICSVAKEAPSRHGIAAYDRLRNDYGLQLSEPRRGCCNNGSASHAVVRFNDSSEA